MRLVYALIYIGIIGLIVFAIPMWIGCNKLFKDIRSQEPEFLNNNQDLNGDISSKPAQFPWLIFRGRYKNLKNFGLRKRCNTQRIFCILSNICFVVVFLAILYLAVFH